jgi:hypothetical protein
MLKRAADRLLLQARRHRAAHRVVDVGEAARLLPVADDRQRLVAQDLAP